MNLHSEKEREAKMLEEDRYLEETKKWMEEGKLKGVIRHKMEIINLQTLEILFIQTGFLRCGFTVTTQVSGEDGKWHPGSIVTVIDNVGAATIHSASGLMTASVVFSVSFYSTAQIQEEVIIEGKIVGEKGKMSSVLVEVRRKDNRELIALGKQWMNNSDNIQLQVRALSKL